MKATNKYLFYGIGALVGIGLIYLLHQTLKDKHYFKLSDFDSPDQKGSGNYMNNDFLIMLQKVEDLVGFELEINSGFRTDFWNRKVKGVRSSAHRKGEGADIKASSKAKRDKIVWMAKKVGFKRIGIGETFVHLDIDTTKPQYVAWGYPAGTPPPFNPFA